MSEDSQAADLSAPADSAAADAASTPVAPNRAPIPLSKPVVISDQVVPPLTLTEVSFRDAAWSDLAAGDGKDGTEWEIAIAAQLSGQLPAVLSRVGFVDALKIRERVYAVVNETAPDAEADRDDPDLIVFPEPVVINGDGGSRSLSQVRFKPNPTWGDLSASDGVLGATAADIALAAHLCGTDSDLLGRLPLPQANRVRRRLADFFGK